MIKVAIFLFMMLFLPATVSAKVDVNISNNLEGTNNTVDINSNTSGGETSGVRNQTDIVINNNGQVKEYHGTDSRIEINSDDGKSSVNINNNSATSTKAQNLKSGVTSSTSVVVNSNTLDSTASAAPSPEATVAGVFMQKKENESVSGLWGFIKREFDKLLELFS